LADHLGSVIGLTDINGNLQTSYNYSAYGKKQTTGVASSNPFAFTGREDDGNGYYYYRARYYNPDLKRFTAEDPAEFGGGDTNLYGYVGGGPTNQSDPSGNQIAPPMSGGGIPIGVPSWLPGILRGLAPVGAGLGVWMHEDTPIASDEEEARIIKANESRPGCPALPDDPYSPKSVNKRQTGTRRELGIEPIDPNTEIPDQPPGRNLKGSHSADPTEHHGTGERNVGTKEEHSRVAKGSHGQTKR
jgi:RHS repeat-associated protein